jgi:DNA polymerase-1
LSQIELRLLAAACGDPNMMQAYFDDLDLHTLTTSRIFKLDYEMFSKDYMEKLQNEGKGKLAKELELKRKIGKTCNFLTGYGGGAFGLQTTLANSKIYMSIEECESILAQFFDSYPTLKKFLSAYKYFIQQNGAAVSITGRVRIFEEVFSDDTEASAKALRAGCNHLIQATASDMMLVCLRVIEAAMRDQGLESLLVSTVHDSLVVDTVRDEAPAVHEIVYTVLNSIPEIFELVFGPTYDTSWMLVPFGGDSEIGLNYGHMNKVPTKGLIDWDKLLKPE